MRRAMISSANMASFGSLHGFALGQAQGNHWGEAVTLLENCISVCTPEERELLTRYLKEAKRGVPDFN